MAIYRVQHSFQGLSGTPEDQFVNTFHFLGTYTDDTNLSALSSAVEAFYSAIPTGKSASIRSYMSGVADAPGARVKMYDLADSQPRPAKFDRTYSPSSMGGAASVNLPGELACCLSYAAVPAAGIKPHSRRGRIYLGPFNANALAGGGLNVEAEVDQGLREIIIGAATQLATTAGVAGWDWSVYSPTLEGASEIVRFWCDNAWDVQRRRGVKPSSRITAVL